MTLSLIWHPRVVSPIGPTIGPDYYTGDPMAAVWSGFGFDGWPTNPFSDGWTARQIKRWETQTGFIWTGRRR